jgi:hypothetical protein
MAEQFPGVYRSVFPCVCEKVIFTQTLKQMQLTYPDLQIENFNNEVPELFEIFTSVNLINFISRQWWEFACRAAAITVSHPFHVIAVRSIAEIVGSTGSSIR